MAPDKIGHTSEKKGNVYYMKMENVCLILSIGTLLSVSLSTIFIYIVYRCISYWRKYLISTVMKSKGYSAVFEFYQDDDVEKVRIIWCNNNQSFMNIGLIRSIFI